jgi:integrase
LYYLIMKAGRWATAIHPEVASPELWTRNTAADYIAAVCRMRIGEWSNHVNYPSERGKPLTPRSICSHLTAMRVFFRDCQDWEWMPRRFDPNRCLQAPVSVRSRIGPDPRILADDVWAKLVWAGLNLQESDLPITGSRHHFYPTMLVRAMTIVWLFAGLRSDEILRLRVGSVRWRDSQDEAGGKRTCLLHVPVNKTSTAFVKPVDPIVGEAIEKWEAVRPRQPLLLDKKTGELVELLFTYRTRQLSRRYLNQVVIPALCTKAGVPRRDARDPITSHRARATIATQLFNAKEGLSLFELQEWMGHRSAQSTQHYAKISATKMARSYAQAGYFERNLRVIDVLIDQEAVRSGLVANVPWKYYDLGHGYCTYDFFDQCPHRMACAKCSFYRPKPSAKSQLLEGKENLLRFRQEIPLQETEIAAVEDGIAALESLIGRLMDTPTPAGPTPRQLRADELVQIQSEVDGHARLD